MLARHMMGDGAGLYADEAYLCMESQWQTQGSQRHRLSLSEGHPTVGWKGGGVKMKLESRGGPLGCRTDHKRFHVGEKFWICFWQFDHCTEPKRSPHPDSENSSWSHKVWPKGLKEGLPSEKYGWCDKTCTVPLLQSWIDLCDWRMIPLNRKPRDMHGFRLCSRSPSDTNAQLP